MRALIVSTNRCREAVPVMPTGACDAADLLRPTFYVSPALKAAWLVERLKETARCNRRFVQPLGRPGPLLRAGRGLGYLLGLRPPLWKHAGWVRRVAG